MICIKADTLNGMNNTEFLKYFEFTGHLIPPNSPVESFSLVPCTPDMWSLLGESYKQIFSDYKVGTYFCMPELM